MTERVGELERSWVVVVSGRAEVVAVVPEMGGRGDGGGREWVGELEREC